MDPAENIPVGIINTDSNTANAWSEKIFVRNGQKNKKSGKTKEAVHHSQIVVNSDGKIVNEQYYFNASALPN